MDPLSSELISRPVDLIILDPVTGPIILDPTTEEAILDVLATGDVDLIRETNAAKIADLSEQKTSTGEFVPGRVEGERNTLVLQPAPQQFSLAAAPTTASLTTFSTATLDDLVAGFDVDANIDALAIGIENQAVIDTAAGNDLVVGDGVALGIDSAEAFGILNAGEILTGTDADSVVGVGSASGLFGLAVEGDAIAFGFADVDGGLLNVGNGDNTVTGHADAAGTEQVEATGLLALNAISGGGDDTFDGLATADGENIATASGIRVGSFEDNTVAVAEGEPLPNQIGSLDAGDGTNTITGTATGTTTSDGTDVLFNDVNGILVDVDSVLNTGNDVDTITGFGTAIDDGIGGGNFLTLNALSADGIEIRGDLSTGIDGDDSIIGTGVGQATNSFVVAEGVDIGLGNNQNVALGGNPNLVNVFPTVNLGEGNNAIIGVGESTVEGDDAATITAGIQSVGTILAGAGNDTLEGSATSVVVGGANEAIPGILPNRGAIADGIQNFVIVEALNTDFDGTIDLGEGDNVLTAEASATAEDFSAFATGVSGGVLRVGAGNDTIEGNTEAVGVEDVGATGVLFVDADLGDGANVIIGSADSIGAASTDARGISIGLSDIDDDTLQNPDDTAGAQAAQVGTLITGDGNDTFFGTATVDSDADRGFGDSFFSNATALTVDGGTVEELALLLAGQEVVVDGVLQPVDLEILARASKTAFGALVVGIDDDALEADELLAVQDAVRAVLPDLDIGRLDTGAGNDTFNLTASNISVGGIQGLEDVDGDGEADGDANLEYFVEGFENSGFVTFGDGDDSIVANVSGFQEGAGKILVEGIDNSGVGVSTGLALENDNDNTILDFGAGDDSITINTEVLSIGDFAAGDGIDNRGQLLLGEGSDTITINAVSEFQRQEIIDGAGNVIDGDQEEGLADGIENRQILDLGSGNDTITSTVQATSNGILGIAEAVESRFFLNAGDGADTFNLTATAIASADVLADNLTQASGLQLEQVTSGTFLLGNGDDILNGTGTAIGLDNNETVAFGISQATAEATAIAEEPTGEAPLTEANAGAPVNLDDVGLLDTGEGNNTLTGVGNASGLANSQVEAYGILATNTVGRGGNDTFDGTATADGGNIATASGIRIGTFEDNTVAVAVGEPLPNEAGALDAGNGINTVAGTATGTTTSDGINVLFNDVNGVLVDVDSDLIAGNAADTISGSGTTIDNGVGGGNFLTLNALSADGVEARGDISTGGGADTISGTGVGEATNSFVVVEGVDVGFGNNLNNALGGNPNLVDVAPIVDLGAGDNRISGTGTSTVNGADASTIVAGIQSLGTILGDGGNDTLEGSATSTVIGGEAGIRGAVADGIQNVFNSDDLDVNQVGTINLGNGDNFVSGDATATANDFNAIANGVATGNLITSTGNDTLNGNATATALTEAAALGLEIGDVNLGDGANSLSGVAAAESASAALASGISVGTDSGVGSLVTGNGNDIIQGQGTTDADGNDLEDSNANGIFVAAGSNFDTDAGVDTIVGFAVAGAVGTASSPEFAVLTDGIENQGTLLTGAQGDIITGEGSSFGVGVEATAGGIDNGRALVEQPSFVSPVFNSQGGSDEIVATATATAINNAAITDALSNVGDFRTGGDADTITATATSDASGFVGDRAVADAIDNRDFIATGGGSDSIFASATATAVNGTASANAIDQNEAAGSRINLGDGNDTLIAEATATSTNGDAEAIGLFGGTIQGNGGADNIRARSNDLLTGANGISLAGGQGFGGNVTVAGGADDDTFLGFGEAHVQGGSGFDTLQFEFLFDDFVNGGGNINVINNGSADFTFDGVTLEARNIEQFDFGVSFDGTSIAESFSGVNALLA